MNNSQVKSVATTTPAGNLSQDHAIELLDRWLNDQDTDRLPFSRGRSREIFRNAGVNERSTVRSPENLLQAMDFGEKSDRFLEHAPALAETVIGKAIDHTNIELPDIDLLITVSCTGFSIPSLDAYLMNELDFAPDTRRLPIAELGCAAGASALSRARDYLEAYPDSKVLVLSVELCTLNFQPGDLTRAQIVSAALFGDGAAAVVLSNDTSNPSRGPKFLDYESKFFHDSLEYMGYKNNQQGMSIMLSPKIPGEVRSSGGAIVRSFLDKHDLSPGDIDHFVAHPGGQAILDALEEALDLDGDDLAPSRLVLEQFGNLSSTTVLFVLEEVLSSNPSTGDLGLVLAFGPGFNADLGLLSW